MTETITAVIVAVLSMLGTSIGAYFSNRKQTALIAYRIEELEKKQDVHNGVIERMYEAETRIAIHEENFKVVNHRIKDLEELEHEKAEKER